MNARTRTMLSLALSAAAATLLLLLPMSAQAAAAAAPAATQHAVAPAQHLGWVYINMNHCTISHGCPSPRRWYANAWSYDTATKAWKATYVTEGWWYVRPYSGAWRWAWTPSVGWIAVHGSAGRFEVRPF